MIQKGNFSARKIIKQFDVRVLCTTDDPIDALDYHKAVKEDEAFDVQVLPTFRPDGALNIQSNSFIGWVGRLRTVTDLNVATYQSFIEALQSRVDYFHQVDCRLSDHGLDTPFLHRASAERCNYIFKKALNKEEISDEEAEQFQTSVLLELGKMYAEKGWAMQLHIGGLRNTNTKMIEKSGIKHRL